MKITLATLHLATAQEVADQIVNHLLDQGEQSAIVDAMGESFCQYRSNNLACAAGCLISDEEYKEKFEGLNWCALTQRHSITKNHEKLIAYLQAVHDDYGPCEWEEKLRRVLNMEGLKFNRNKV